MRKNIALIEQNKLTIISPKQKAKQFDLILHPKEGLDSRFQLEYEERPVKNIDEILVKETIAFYQTSYDQLKKKEYEKKL